MGFLNKVKGIVLPEGNRLVFSREDGTEQEMDFKATQVEVSIPREELQTLNPQQMISKFDQAAVEMAKLQHVQTFSEISRAVTAVGNAVEARGQPMGPAQFFEALERISIEFNDRGEPRLPTMVIHPDMEPTVRATLTSIEYNSELQFQYAEIIARKREEWRARESRRKLVG
jgi:hypothetical protein